MRAKKRRFHLPLFDTLESRVVLSMTRTFPNIVSQPVTASLQNGMLSIVGTDGPNEILVRLKGTNIEVEGVAQKFPVAQVGSIVVQGLGGNDVIRLDSNGIGGAALVIPCTIDGGGSDTISGGLAGGRNLRRRRRRHRLDMGLRRQRHHQRRRRQ